MTDPKPKDRCPVCGHQFTEIPTEPDKVVVCPKHGLGIDFFTRDELITEDEDCAYCL